MFNLDISSRFYWVIFVFCFAVCMCRPTDFVLFTPSVLIQGCCKSHWVLHFLCSSMHLVCLCLWNWKNKSIDLLLLSACVMTSSHRHRSAWQLIDTRRNSFIHSSFITPKQHEWVKKTRQNIQNHRQRIPQRIMLLSSACTPTYHRSRGTVCRHTTAISQLYYTFSGSRN